MSDLPVIKTIQKKPRNLGIVEKIVQDLRKGIYDVDYFMLNYPTVTFQNFIKIQQINDYYKEKNRLSLYKKSHVFNFSIKDHYDSSWRMVVTFLNNVIGRRLSLKRMHLWIYGKANVGKTTQLYNPLTRLMPCYIIQKDPQFNTRYINGLYKLAICDEYGGQKPITDLNEFTSGEQVQLRIPGGGYDMKKEQVPVIILSQYSIEECYSSEIHNGKKSKALEALEQRFYQVELFKSESIFGVTNDVNKQSELDKLMYNR